MYLIFQTLTRQAFFSFFTGRNMPGKIGACGGPWKKAHSKEYVVTNKFTVGVKLLPPPRGLTCPTNSPETTGGGK